MNKLLIIFLSTAIGLLIGGLITFYNPAYDVYWVYLEHQKEKITTEDYKWLQNKAIKLDNGIVGRSYNIGVNSKRGNPRSELKLYIPKDKDADKIIKQFSKNMANTPTIVNGTNFVYESRSYDPMVHWLIIGLFFGVLIQFLVPFYRKSQTNK